MSAFANIRLDEEFSYGFTGSPDYSTAISAQLSGVETRISRWARPQRRYNAAYGIKAHTDLSMIRTFFIARRGSYESFRIKDWSDFSSAADGVSPATPADQFVGVGNGTQTIFQLIKRYSSGGSAVDVPITKPVSGTVVVRVNGVDTTAFTVNDTTGRIVFGTAPANGHAITAGFEHDVVVRFGDPEQTRDILDQRYDSYGGGTIPQIPLIEEVEDIVVPGDFNARGSREVVLSSADFEMSLAQAGFYAVNATASGRAMRCPTPAAYPLGRLWSVANMGTNSITVKSHTGTTLVTLNTNQGVDVCLGQDSSLNKVWYTI